MKIPPPHRARDGAGSDGHSDGAGSDGHSDGAGSDGHSDGSGSDGHSVKSREPLVLVVDDHEDTRELFRVVLEAKGYRVIEGRNGEEAFFLAERNRPDLILMDTNLPQVDGLMATKRIRELAQLTNVPILFISGHAEPKHRALAMAAGGDDYFVKPVRVSELESAVDRYLKRNLSSNESQLTSL